MRLLKLLQAQLDVNQKILHMKTIYTWLGELKLIVLPILLQRRFSASYELQTVAQTDGRYESELREIAKECSLSPQVFYAFRPCAIFKKGGTGLRALHFPGAPNFCPGLGRFGTSGGSTGEFIEREASRTKGLIRLDHMCPLKRVRSSHDPFAGPTDKASLVAAPRILGHGKNVIYRKDL